MSFWCLITIQICSRLLFGGLLSCGGWIYDSIMELPLLKKVILIGPDEEAFSRVEPEFKEKVEFLSRERLLEMEETEVSAFVKNQVGEYPLYISIDKDVLCETDADTNWSQGDMRLVPCWNVWVLSKRNVQRRISRILGVDICGECDVTEPGNSALNDMANAALLEFLHLQMWVRILRKTKTGQQEETDEK